VFLQTSLEQLYGMPHGPGGHLGQGKQEVATQNTSVYCPFEVSTWF
jgi:hypothetical protein